MQIPEIFIVLVSSLQDSSSSGGVLGAPSPTESSTNYSEGSSGLGIGSMLCLISVPAVFLILFILSISAQRKEKQQERDRLEELAKKTLRFESNIESVKKRFDFQSDDIFVNRLDHNAIAIDSVARKLLIITDSLQQIVNPNDLLAVEITVDDTSVTITNRGSQAVGAAVGGLILGPAGLIVGGLSGSKRATVKVKKLSLAIETSHFDCPNHEFVFFKSTMPQGDNVDSECVADATQKAMQWRSRVLTLLKEGNRSRNVVKENSRISVADEIEKLNKLCNDNVITEAEFNAAKAKLLGSDD